MSAEFVAVLPARFASTRLPGKPLADLGGRPMIVRVAERASLSGATEVIVATDSEAVRRAVEAAGFTAVMTRADHTTGTDRIAEVAAIRGWPDDRIVVNVQGDEPRIDPRLVRQVAECLDSHPDAAVATASHAISEDRDYLDPNVVKVVTDRAGGALYFSRAPVPHARDWLRTHASLAPGLGAQRHIGIYAYRCRFLKAYATLAPAPIETIEALEQLRALWHGYRIVVATTAHVPEAGVDTPEDLERVRALYRDQTGGTGGSL